MPTKLASRMLRCPPSTPPWQPNASFPLRVFMEVSPQWTWGRRVCGALRDFAATSEHPVCFVGTREGADVELVHLDRETEASRALSRPAHAPPFVAFQHGLAFADAPRSLFRAVWKRSILTVSFQDLAADASNASFAFMPMPWGADDGMFTPSSTDTHPTTRRSILMMGDQPDIESLGEILFAAAHANLTVRHIGDPINQLCGACGRFLTTPFLCEPLDALGGRSPCAFHTNLGRVSDAQLVKEMREALYVPALRKFEGFEISGAEALFCGTRPIVYDISTYRWYTGHAAFVPSGLESTALFHRLVGIFQRSPQPVSRSELRELHATFAWGRLVPRLFARIRERLAVG